MIKVTVVDNMGMVIGDVEDVSDELIHIHLPLFLAPSSQGNISLQSNPLFDSKLEVNKRYIVASSTPKQSMLEQYEAYTTQKKTGLIVTPNMPQSGGGKILT